MCVLSPLGYMIHYSVTILGFEVYTRGMKIYFCGIGGVGLGPLAEIARDAGHTVIGSDQAESLTTRELAASGVEVSFVQDGTFLRATHDNEPIEWFVYTAGLPAGHPELVAAQELGIRTSKRDELLSQIIRDKDLRLIAVAGTHGKTTVTGMTVWMLQQLHVPVSYSIGSTIGFGPSGKYVEGSQYFVYECDEFDRNFLHFLPEESLIVSVDYDHPDVYPDEADYRRAFADFAEQSQHVISWQSVVGSDIGNPTRDTLLADSDVMSLRIAGAHNRANATLVATLGLRLGLDAREIRTALETFPGTLRRFEKLESNLYSDYGHHPVEIRATLQMARELSDHVVLVYQPHQNVRQHQIFEAGGYGDCTAAAEHVYWLPTYLSREDADLPVLSPDELTRDLPNHQSISLATMDDTLWDKLVELRERGCLVVCMGAGSIDGWIRQRLAE